MLKKNCIICNQFIFWIQKDRKLQFKCTFALFHLKHLANVEKCHCVYNMALCFKKPKKRS